jgi:hypothetical protein
MKDRQVVVLQHLTALLVDATTSAEDLEQVCDSLRKELEESRDALIRANTYIDGQEDDNIALRKQVERLEVSNRELSRNLADQNYADHTNRSLSAVYQTLFYSPEKAEKIRTFISQEGEVHLLNNKIYFIKNVREITGCGLKEAKDFVEAFLWSRYAPASTPAPTVRESK